MRKYRYLQTGLLWLYWCYRGTSIPARLRLRGTLLVADEGCDCIGCCFMCPEGAD